MKSKGLAAAEAEPERPLLFGRFELIMELGTGGCGRVVLCRDAVSGEFVALKELRRFGPEALVRFKREFRTLSDVQHPNLVRLGELFEEDARWAFTLEYVPGHDALSWVRTPECDHDFDEERIGALLRGLVQGLTAIHALGIVHRDIKPENVRVTGEGRVVILDFGIAEHIEEEQGTDGVLGTAGYMSPEQAMGMTPSPADDWYAVGALLYEALTGALPFRGGALEILLKKQSRLPKTPSSLAANVPRSLERICMALLHPDASARAGGDEILEMLDGRTSDVRSIHASASRSDEVFVGRHHELIELDQHLDAVERGSSKLVLIEGESGIGKSALVSRFVAIARRREQTPLVLHGRCHAAERLLYKAFDGVVDELSRCLKGRPRAETSGLLANDAHLLPLLFPVLTRVQAIALARSSNSKELLSSAQLHRAFAALLQRISEEVPIIIAIDDLQWADELSMALLETIVDHAANSRLLIVATVRPIALLSDAVGQRLTALLKRPRVSRLSIGRLRASESRELVSRLLGEGASKECSDRLVHESGGHPLFVTELVRHAQESSDVEAELDLDAAIVARVEQLDAHALEALTVSCLAAGPLPYSVLSAAVDMAPETLRTSMAKLRMRKLLRVAQSDETIFYHDRIREAVVQSRDAALRAAYHRALARAWEAETDVEPVRVAYHFLQAGMRKRAVPWLVAAAERAKKALAFERAAELYRRALSGVERGSPERQNLSMQLGLALQHAGRREEAARAFEGAARHSQGVTQQAMLLRAGDQWLTGGSTRRGLALLRKVGVRVPRSVVFTLMRAAYHFVAMALVRNLRIRSSPVSEDGQTARVDSYWALTTGLAFIEPLQSLYFAMKGARLSLRLGDSHRMARGLCGAAFAAAALGRKALSLRLNALATQAAVHEATPLAEFYAEGGRFLSAFMIDHDWRACVSKRQKLHALWRSAGLGRTYEIDVADLVETWALANLGNLHVLRRRTEELKEINRHGENPFLEGALRVYHSMLFLAADDASGAETDLDDALRSFSPGGDRYQLPHAWASFSRGEIFLYRGLPERRTELDGDLKGLRSMLLDRIQWIGVRRDHIHARLALAEAAKSTGEVRAHALRDARHWLEKLHAHRAPAAKAWALLLEAGMAQVEGDAQRARRNLKQAVAAFSALHMSMYERASRLRLCELTGARDAERHREWFAENGVKNVRRMLRVLTPGWL